MAKYTELNIRITGEGGHGSSPEGIKVAILKGV